MKTDDKRGAFSLSVKDGALKFSTPHYTAGRGSILHSGIYNEDLSAMISAAGTGAACFVLFRYASTPLLPNVIMSVIVFAATFLFFRLVVFKKRELHLMMDKASNRGVVIVPFKKTQTFRLSEVSGVKSFMVELAPENPEGVRLVEKIALHHYTVLPDFEKTVELYSVELRLKNGSSFALFASEDGEASARLTARIEEFLKVA